jgi:hypothetical protein
MSDAFYLPLVHVRRATPGRNGHAGRDGTTGGLRSCPSCGVAGVRYLRSTGRWHRDSAGETSFGYVTFCSACGHEYGETEVS